MPQAWLITRLVLSGQICIYADLQHTIFRGRPAGNYNMGSLKKRRKAKINKHKRRKKLRAHRHKKRTWQK